MLGKAWKMEREVIANIICRFFELSHTIMITLGICDRNGVVVVLRSLQKKPKALTRFLCAWARADSPLQKFWLYCFEGQWGLQEAPVQETIDSYLGLLGFWGCRGRFGGVSCCRRGAYLPRPTHMPIMSTRAPVTVGWNLRRHMVQTQALGGPGAHVAV